MSDYVGIKAVGLTSNHNKELLDKIALSKKIPITRLVAIAIENELLKDNPFNYDIDTPSEEYTPLAFASEAQKILDYLGKVSGLSLDMLCILRHDIGIPDKKLFMLAFRECLLSNFLEEFKPKMPRFVTFKYDDDYVFYRIKGSGKKEQKEIRKKASKYETYQKLKREFKDE